MATTIPQHRLQLADVAGRQYGALLRVSAANPIDPALGHLIDIRASQINGCAFCLDMHTTDALKEGESSQRLFGLAAWRESSFYDERERVALALADAVTLLERTGVPDEVWDPVVEHFGEEGAANVLLAIGTINLWTRLNIATRRQPDLVG